MASADLLLELRPDEGRALTIRWNHDALRALLESKAAAGVGSPWSIEDGGLDPGTELRLLSAAFEDESLLGLAALRLPGAQGHGDDAIGAVLLRPEQEPATTGALLSTEYDAAGQVRRAGVEVSVDPDAPPLRVAGDAGSWSEEGSGCVAAMTFRMGGARGAGLYELVRG